MLKQEHTALVVIDVQGKLAQVMTGKELLFENLKKMVQGAQVLGVPILWLEQNPAGLGPTIPELAELMKGLEPISKLSFSACGEGRFLHALKALGRKQILLVGIETHVCVYQTAVDLIALGHEVQVVADAVSSRTQQNKEIGLQRMKGAGASVTSVETALFELLRVAKGDPFKQMLRIVK